MVSVLDCWKRRLMVIGVALNAMTMAPIAQAQVKEQAQPIDAVPAYRAEHALQGLHAHHSRARWAAFSAEAAALTQAASEHCSGHPQAAALASAWGRARRAWMEASNPALGPLITRRSQREIDFWPVRPAMLERALASPPQDLAQMARVGGPAKGFAAMEAVLAAPPAAVHCPYLRLLAQGIEVEAQALSKAFAELATKDWTADEAATRSAFAEWINQWLAGVEHLRWQQIEQPILKARAAGAGQAAKFARREWLDNRADWQAQWFTLEAQARLNLQQRSEPPAPGQALLPIEALLLGKGQITLARRWGEAIDTASSAMAAVSRIAALPAPRAERELLAFAQSLKAVSALYQREVAAALDVPLGFSSADGD
jgi:uncharacterized protein